MTDIELFESNDIRTVFDGETQKLYFAVVDVIQVLTNSTKPRNYWYDLKRREKAKSGVELSANCRQFKLKANNNRMYEYDCADREVLLRIIQSIPSPKAEPFKLWLAQVGRERIEEIENPELAAERMRQIYLAKGYDEEWIEKRLQSIAVRNELTNEWENRGVKKGLEYAILTADISRGAFNISPKEHKQVKNLKNENLRDHMTTLELVLTMLGEATTTELARHEDSQGFTENQQVAQRGGQIAGNARKEIEAQTGRPIVSSKNYLTGSKPEQIESLDKDEKTSGSN